LHVTFALQAETSEREI